MPFADKSLIKLRRHFASGALSKQIMRPMSSGLVFSNCSGFFMRERRINARASRVDYKPTGSQRLYRRPLYLSNPALNSAGTHFMLIG